MPATTTQSENHPEYPNEQSALAYHECSHAVFAHLLSIPVKSLTLIGDAHITFTWSGAIRLLLDGHARGIVFQAGCITQKDYFPEVPVTALRDKKILTGILGLPPRKLKICRVFIRRKLQDPDIRNKILKLSAALLTHKCLNKQQIQDILNAL